MGPSKRKGSVRRPVLDLNTREGSPSSTSRPTWQNKYQHVLPGDGVHQNGDSQPSSSPATKSNPLSGLLGNYNSDSDSEEPTQQSNPSLDSKVEDFLKEIQSIASSHDQSETIAQSKVQEEALYPPSVTAWQQCYDHNSGYPYYWNTETNEVTWEMPADLKAAIASVALKQQQEQQKEQQQQQQQHQPTLTPAVEETKKKVCKYPWQTESDSEDERIEMITSFGPQSGEESENEQEKPAMTKKVNAFERRLPTGPSSPYSSNIRSDCISLAPEDPDGLNESSYETSSLLAHGVQDTGPPGDDSFQSVKEPVATHKVPASSKKEDSRPVEAKGENTESPQGMAVESSVVLDAPVRSVDTEMQAASKEDSMCESKTPKSIADTVIVQIEKETPPDYGDSLDTEKQEAETDNQPTASESSSQANPSTSSFALIANYGDDSEPEDNNSFSEKLKSSSKFQTNPLFPIEIRQEKPKPLFPCIGVEATKNGVDVRVKESLEEPQPFSNIYNSELDMDDPAAHKAFKRKKRIEFATTIFGPSTSKMPEVKPASPERSFSGCSTQYNMDPNSNEHRGFGFSALRAQDCERKTFKNYGGIQFIKAETINLNSGPKEKVETETDSARAPGSSSKEPVRDEEIEDAATLLREKVNFLTGGKDLISPIQQMAIELETLVLAWQQGALTPPYLLRWLNEKCGELIRHEKAAAPLGWTCLWDRKNKRYYYRSTTTKAIQWEYPNVEEKGRTKEGEPEHGGDEMDICDTPPHLSPAGPEKPTDEPPSTPPPPVISDVSENVSPPSPTPQPPPPPQISFSSEIETSKSAKKKKRRAEEMSVSNEVDGDMSTTVGTSRTMTAYESCESVEAVPPLPPMPPPPPPPPDESPPPLPDSPPPLPLDPNQPLPPGVDEPEYSLFRHVSPKHTYKKAQPETTPYSAELMMTYGYGLPVQQVVPSGTQAMTMQMQPLEYHTYMHEAVTNPYLVQSAPTSHVIHCPAKKPKPSLTSELVSFYSDLAMLDSSPVDNSSSNSQNVVPAPPTPAVSEPIVPPVQNVTTAPSTSTTNSVVSTTLNSTESVTSNGVNVKKKKKGKATSGLALKKKGVSSLVAKWQQVQQEVRKDFSDDEDDIASTK